MWLLILIISVVLTDIPLSYYTKDKSDKRRKLNCK